MMNWCDTGPSIFVNAASRAELLADLCARMQVQQGYSIATLNLDHTVKIRRDADFREAYAAHSHITADGNPIVWISGIAGQRVELIPGSELIEPVAELAAKNDVPVAMIGSTSQTLAAAAKALKARYPRLNIVEQIAPPMGFDPSGAQADAAIEACQKADVRLVFLAFGAPKQEVFAAYAQEKLPRSGFLSIGAGLDFIAGTQMRAPKWVRKLAAEWLWRLATNPTRLARRYGACIAILPRLTRTAYQSRGASK